MRLRTIFSNLGRAGISAFHTVVVFAAVSLAVAACAGSAKGAPVLVFIEGTGANAANLNQSVGWQFNVLSPLTLVGLGWYDQGGDGLSAAHRVGIWAPDGTLLASTLVPAGTAAPLDGQFRTAAVAPLVLTPGAGYIIGGENFSTNTERLAFNVSQVVDPRILYVDATSSLIGSGFVRPANLSIASTGFYGPSFSVQPVPEPVSLALLGSGLAGLAAGLRRRRAAKRGEHGSA